MKSIAKLVLLLVIIPTDAVPAIAQKETNRKYELVFSDEFNLPNGSQPDSTKWVRSMRNPSTWARWISSSKDVVFIKNGKLVCRAIPNRHLETDTASMLTGAVETFGKFSFQYGKVEVRMKTNLKQGNFPAVWLKPVPVRGDSLYGEIDIVETFGNQNSVQHTLHSHMSHILKRNSVRNAFSETISVKRWHVYGMEWTPDSITWTVDGEIVGVYQKSRDELELSYGQWTFDRRFFLRLNQSVGDGSFLRFKPLTNQIYETQFDWIRVYQRNYKL